jgi:hypothetical protein
MDLTIIILGVVIVLILYFYFKSSGSTVLSNKIDLTTQQSSIDIKNITNPTSVKYSYEMWLYVYNFSGASTYIVSRAADTGGGKNIGIKIDGSVPKLSLEYLADTTKTVVITDNFPLQTWSHLIVSVDGTYVDIYMNGKLVKSFQDKNIKASSATATIDYGMLPCYLAKLVRTTTPTNPQSAWDKYSAGNGENPLAKYLASFGMSLTLKKNDQDYSKVTLF